MQNHKGFRRFICVTVLCALLMVSMGRVTRVSAVVTTAAIAGTAFILTGAVYISYVALTQGEMVLPAAEEMHNWLGSIGRKVSQYPSGAAAYQDIYQGLLRDPTANVIDGVWTWTQDRIKSFANDFSDTRIISNIVGYHEYVDISQIATNGFTYSNQVTIPDLYYYNSSYYTRSQLNNIGLTVGTFPGKTIAHTLNNNIYFINTELEGSVRNLYKTNGKYIAQILVDGVWTQDFPTNSKWGNPVYAISDQSFFGTAIPLVSIDYYTLTRSVYSYSFTHERTYPIFPMEVIHDEASDRDLPMVIPESDRLQLPSWVDPDNNNRPVIPWLPIPDLPFDVPTPPGYTGPPQWGFPLQNLLDLLESLAEALLNIDVIARLINEFAGQHGDNYYLEYNDGDTNYYTYYQPTIFDNDTEYVTYNIDISEQEEVIPVDLNTISLYTKNEYLDAVKQSARNFGDAIGEYVAFWHNSDYTLTYTILGGFVLILIGAFIGKWGHS